MCVFFSFYPVRSDSKVFENGKSAIGKGVKWSTHALQLSTETGGLIELDFLLFFLTSSQPLSINRLVATASEKDSSSVLSGAEKDSKQLL